MIPSRIALVKLGGLITEGALANSTDEKLTVGGIMDDKHWERRDHL